MITIIQGPDNSGKVELANLLAAHRPVFIAKNTWEISGIPNNRLVYMDVDELSPDDILRLEKQAPVLEAIILVVHEVPSTNIQVFRLKPALVLR